MGAIVENIDRLCWTDVEKAELRPAAAEAVGRDADVGRRVDEAFPEVEVDGESVEVAAWRSRVEAGVGGAPGAVLVLRGGGPVQEGSGGSVAVVEVCRSDVSLEESVALRGGGVGWAELGSESTRWEESVKMDNPPPSRSSSRWGQPAPSKQNTANFRSSLVAHGTTPVLPLPHLLSAVSRGMTTIRSAVQPYLRGEHASSGAAPGQQQPLRLGSLLKAVILELLGPPERTPVCPQNAPLNPGGLLVLLNDTALGLLAGLQAVLQRSLHLGSAGNAGVPLPAGSSRGAEAEGVVPSLGEQEDPRCPGTSCRHSGKKRKMHVEKARSVLMSKRSHSRRRHASVLL